MMPTVMIVENNPHLGYLLERYASTSRCRPVTARFAEQALVLARRERPDVIFVGPGEIGRRALHELEADDATRAVPVVVCSWLAGEQAGPLQGAHGHLQTPIQYRDFLAALQEAGVRRPTDPADVSPSALKEVGME